MYDTLAHLSFDNIEDFKQTMSLFPTGTLKTNRDYLLKYKKGDIEARDMLVYTNLRLVFRIAEEFNKISSSMVLLDFIQEGIIGLIDGIDRFDITKDGFTKYIKEYIYGYIKRAIDNKDKMIRRSVNLIEKSQKLNKLIAEYESKGLKVPDDKQICKQINITPETLERIRKDCLYDTVSSNAKVRDDEDSSELEKFLEDKQQTFALTISLENKSLLSYLKETLPKDNYFIIYHLYLTSPSVGPEEIGKKLSISRQRIDQKAKKTLLDLKSLCENGTLNYKSTNLKNLDNVLPIDPDNIIDYLFFRDTFTEEEKRVFKLKISEKYLHDEDFAHELGISVKEYRSLLNSCIDKVKLNNQQTKDQYDFFKIAILNEYQSRIFNIDLDIDLSKLSTGIKSVHNEWKDQDYEKAVSVIGSTKINTENDSLLKRYFNTGQYNTNINLRTSEREINVLLYGLNRHADLPSQKLFQTLIQNRNTFNEVEYDFLLMSRFGKMSKKEFFQKHSVKTLPRDKRSEINTRLEKLYFGLFDYSRNTFFDQVKYSNIRSECLDKIDPLRIKLLDMYYGEKKHSIKEIMDITGLNYDEVKTELQKARTLAQKIYIESSWTIKIDGTKYIPYIIDPDVEINEETRFMLKEFIIEHKSYKEILKEYQISTEFTSKKSNMTLNRISHIITEGIQKIDCYRFNIFESQSKYTKQELEETRISSDFSSNEQKVIKLCLNSNFTLAYEKIGKQNVKNLMIRFYKRCFKNKVKSVEIDLRDITKEVNNHVSMRVLNDKERTLLSYIYGIQNDINLTGKKYSREEIIGKHPEFKAKFKLTHDEALNKIRASKINLTRSTFGYMDRLKVEEILKDQRLPISTKQKELLCYSFELDGYPYKNLNDLTNIYGDSESNIRTLIQRAFTTIFKYKNHEISGKTIPEEDILPYLKYFTKKDQEIIKDKYLSNLTLEELASKYNLSDNQIENRLYKIQIHLKDIKENFVKGFDYNYFWDTINQSDIPYYGDIMEAKRIFYLYFEEHLSSEEIISTLNLDYSPLKIDRIIDTISLAVLKRRENIKKPIVLTREEIEDYYNRNSSKMSYDERRVYEDYFNTQSTKYSYSNISPYIIIDILKDRNMKVFDINKADKKEIIFILKNYRHRLTEQTVNTLLVQFEITERELMSGKEQRKVLKLLASAKKQNKKIA